MKNKNCNILLVGITALVSLLTLALAAHFPSVVLAQGYVPVPYTSVAASTFTLANGPTLPIPGGPGSAYDCNTTCASHSLGYTVGSGDALVICAILGANAYILSGDTAYGTWVTAATVPNLKVFQSTATQGTSCAYVITTSTVSSVTMGYSIDAAGWWHIYDIHKSSGSIVAETVPTPTTSASCGSTGSPCAGPTMTITGTNDAIVVMTGYANNACSVASPYTNFTLDANGDASAQFLNTVVTTASSWKQGTSCPTTAVAQFEAVGVAFK